MSTDNKNQTETRLLTGAEILWEVMVREGVQVVFGYPGGATLKIYEELYDIDFLTHVLSKHEQGATHMAEGYAKATGKVGVAACGIAGRKTQTVKNLPGPLYFISEQL